MYQYGHLLIYISQFLEQIELFNLTQNHNNKVMTSIESFLSTKILNLELFNMRATVLKDNKLALFGVSKDRESLLMIYDIEQSKSIILKKRPRIGFRIAHIEQLEDGNIITTPFFTIWDISNFDSIKKIKHPFKNIYPSGFTQLPNKEIAFLKKDSEECFLLTVFCSTFPYEKKYTISLNNDTICVPTLKYITAKKYIIITSKKENSNDIDLVIVDMTLRMVIAMINLNKHTMSDKETIIFELSNCRVLIQEKNYFYVFNLNTFTTDTFIDFSSVINTSFIPLIFREETIINNTKLKELLNDTKTNEFEFSENVSKDKILFFSLNSLFAQDKDKYYTCLYCNNKKRLICLSGYLLIIEQKY